MPYSHSLAGGVVWSTVAGGVFLALRRERLAAAAVVGAAVLSHFLLDVPVHTRDLPLLGEGSLKLGLGLWNHRWVALGLELACLGAGLVLYLRGQPGSTTEAMRATAVVVAILVVVTLATPFFPVPPSAVAFAIQALASYAVLAALAEWLERARSRR